MEQNKFEHLRQPGVIGSRPGADINTMSFAKGNYILMFSEIQKGKWDYGVNISSQALRHIKLPGEGNGWFKSENDAILYGLEVLRRKAKNPEVKAELEAAIYGRMQHTLDLI